MGSKTGTSPGCLTARLVAFVDLDLRDDLDESDLLVARRKSGLRRLKTATMSK
jgi:hypothetical protein